jgi:hypothetical protein
MKTNAELLELCNCWKTRPKCFEFDDESIDALTTALPRLIAENEKLRGRLEEALACVPTNWCDPLLTGPEAVIKVAPFPEVEALLLAVRKRITALKEQTP